MALPRKNIYGRSFMHGGFDSCFTLLCFLHSSQYKHLGQERYLNQNGQISPSYFFDPQAMTQAEYNRSISLFPSVSFAPILLSFHSIQRALILTVDCALLRNLLQASSKSRSDVVMVVERPVNSCFHSNNQFVLFLFLFLFLFFRLQFLPSLLFSFLFF